MSRPEISFKSHDIISEKNQKLNENIQKIKGILKEKEEEKDRYIKSLYNDYEQKTKDLENDYNEEKTRLTK